MINEGIMIMNGREDHQWMMEEMMTDRDDHKKWTDREEDLKMVMLRGEASIMTGCLSISLNKILKTKVARLIEEQHGNQTNPNLGHLLQTNSQVQNQTIKKCVGADIHRLDMIEALLVL